MQVQVNWSIYLNSAKPDIKEAITKNAPKVLETPQGIISMIENSTAFGPIDDQNVTNFFMRCINFLEQKNNEGVDIDRMELIANVQHFLVESKINESERSLSQLADSIRAGVTDFEHECLGCHQTTTMDEDGNVQSCCGNTKFDYAELKANCV